MIFPKRQNTQKPTLASALLLIGLPYRDIIYIVVIVLLLILLIKNYQRSKKSSDLFDQKESELHNLQQESAAAQLASLKARMNPHFIFNSLNSINWFIIKEAPLEASKYLTKFSKLMRLILDNSTAKEISLEEEFNTLKIYLELESMRFTGEFEYSFNVGDKVDLDEIAIPPLILQPFVENAIWHGLLPKKSTGKLNVSVELEEEWIYCYIKDNGVGYPKKPKLQKETGQKSHGIDITKKRMSTWAKTEQELISIQSPIEDGPWNTIVTIKFPAVAYS